MTTFSTLTTTELEITTTNIPVSTEPVAETTTTSDLPPDTITTDNDEVIETTSTSTAPPYSATTTTPDEIIPVMNPGWDVINLDNHSLSAIWGSSTSDVFAVGELGAIIHYDGVEWTKMNSGAGSDLYDVWGFSSRDVYAVGVRGTILHYDGIAWSEMESGTTEDLISIGGNTLGELFTVSNAGTVLGFDGLNWFPMEVKMGTYFMCSDAWGTSPSDVFFLSTYLGKIADIFYFYGTGFVGINSGAEETLWSIWGTSFQDVYAGGTHGVIIHFDGEKCHTVVKLENNIFMGGYSSSPSEVFALGVGGLLLHYDGQKWSSIESGWKFRFVDIWGSINSEIFCISGDSIIQFNGLENIIQSEIVAISDDSI